MCFWIFGKKKNKKEAKVEEGKIEEVKVEETAPATEESINEKEPEEGKIEVNKKDNTTEKKTAKNASAKKAVTKKDPTNEESKTTKAPSKKVYHVSLRKDDGKWQVKYGGGKKAIKLFDTQAEAIKFAEERADSQEGSISIHKKDGKIRKQDYSKKTEEKKTEDK